jgi:hypothetical protein
MAPTTPRPHPRRAVTQAGRTDLQALPWAAA